jgi:hypothetical protein
VKAEEARSIVGATKAIGIVRVIDDLALHELDDPSAGSQTLYVKTPEGWVLEGVMRRWIH